MVAPPHPSGHGRKYLLITTLIVGGIFLLLLTNNNKHGGGITSAVIENVRNSSFGEVIGTKETVVEEDITIPLPRPGHELAFILNSNTIPAIEREVTISHLSLSSADLSPRIKVNGDDLELSNIQEVNLNIAGFTGRLSMDDVLFSMDGSAKRLEINGIALASDNEISISFEGLEYKSASFEEIALDTIQFVSGIGTLKVSDGLEYKLEEGQSVTIYQYLGNLDLSKGAEDGSVSSGSAFEGSSTGVDIIGKSLNLNLR